MDDEDDQPSSSNNTDDDIAAPYSIGKDILASSREFMKRIGNCPYEQREITKPRLSNSKRVFYGPSRGLKELDERRLRIAASVNNTETVTRLLDKGVNPNCGDEFGRSPLHLASCKGYSEVVKLLLDHGANPNRRDSISNTPLHLAACTDHVEVINLLLKAGAVADSLDIMGQTPLQLAQSKLKILKKTENANMDDLKRQVDQVIQLMLLSSKKDESLPQREILSKCNDNVQKCVLRGEIDEQLDNLLDSLSGWAIK